MPHSFPTRRSSDLVHPANAFEPADGTVVFDVVAHETMFAESKRGPDSRKSRMERWTIDPVAGTTVRAVIHDHAQEFPRYDERLTTRPYHYAYSVAIPEIGSASCRERECQYV